MAPKWLKKNSLKNRDDQRTNAAELTLRQSIYPIVLVRERSAQSRGLGSDSVLASQREGEQYEH